MPSAVRRMEIVLADDHVVVRRALRMLLDAQPEFDVVAETGSVQETLRRVSETKPDVLLLDLNLPDGSSVTAIPTLKGMSPHTGIVVLTANHAPGVALQAIRAGALSYLLKDADDGELVKAIAMAAQGRQYLQPEIGALLVSGRMTHTGSADLTAREIDVLRHIALGYTRREIADRLHLSVRTVESHRARIQQKLAVTSRSGLVRYALGNGIVDDDLDAEG